jgi:translation initiation factor 4A
MQNFSENNEEEVISEIDIIKDFDELDLNPDILRGIFAYGFEKPSAIQQKAIKPIIMGRDVIAQAQSGTGKTATFSIAILQRIDISLKKIQAILLVNTRELAEQIKNVISALSMHTDIKTYCCVGGTSVRDDINNIQNGVNIIVGTPGRIYSHIQSQIIHTEDIKLFVLDEADEMLSKGFKDQVYEIFKYMPSTIQVAVFSATMPPEILDVTNKFMCNPLKILVKNDELTLDGIKQFYIAIEKEEWKLETLMDLYQAITVTQVIIYCNTRKKVEYLSECMIARDFVVSQIHGEMDQNERNSVMTNFRTGKTRVLIATDIIARGIDVQQVSLVINYDIPKEKECYIHRIGRSGRHGRKGVSINFITRYDINKLKEIESFYSTEICEMPMTIADLL